MWIIETVRVCLFRFLLEIKSNSTLIDWKIALVKPMSASVATRRAQHMHFFFFPPFVLFRFVRCRFGRFSALRFNRVTILVNPNRFWASQPEPEQQKKPLWFKNWNTIWTKYINVFQFQLNFVAKWKWMIHTYMNIPVLLPFVKINRWTFLRNPYSMRPTIMKLFWIGYHREREKEISYLWYTPSQLNLSVMCQTALCA